MLIVRRSIWSSCLQDSARLSTLWRLMLSSWIRVLSARSERIGFLDSCERYRDITRTMQQDLLHSSVSQVVWCVSLGLLRDTCLILSFRVKRRNPFPLCLRERGYLFLISENQRDLYEMTKENENIRENEQKKLLSLKMQTRSWTMMMSSSCVRHL